MRSCHLLAKQTQMKNRKIIITHGDFRKLKQLVFSDVASKLAPNSNLADLRNELEQAEVVEGTAVPGDVITMNSTVRLKDSSTGEVDTYTLVFPDEANISQNRLSILAPIGTAILGYRVGDKVRWRVPSGWRKVEVEAILYQPEREGAQVSQPLG